MATEISEHVTSNITTDNVGVPRIGFGKQMIMSCNATFAERSRTYTGLPGMVTDGMVSTSPEYRAARRAFSQKPRPASVKVGRLAGKPTMVYKVDVVAVRHSHVYSLTIDFQGGTEQTVTYTSDASALNDEIIAGLVTAVNAVTSKNFTATETGSALSKDMLITANAAGAWFSVQINSVSDLAIATTHAEPATLIADDMDAVVEEDDDFYGITYLYPSDACTKALSAWAEDKVKIVFANCSDSETVTLASGGGDLADDLAVLEYARTTLIYHPSPAAFAGAAWQGRVLPTTPGRATWKFKTLTTVAPVNTTPTHRANLRAKHANCYTTVVPGSSITWEGTTCDGDFIDVTRGVDWIDDDMTKGVYEAFIANDIIPMTNAGVNTVRGKMEATLTRATENGILSPDEPYELVVPKVSAILVADKLVRKLPDMNWSATLANAVHKVEMNGTVSV